MHDWHHQQGCMQSYWDEKADRRMTMERCEEKAPMIATVAESPGWAKLWDHDLDLGWNAVLGLKLLSRATSHHERGEHPCHIRDEATPLLEKSVLDHILARHHQELFLKSESMLDSSKLIGLLSSLQVENLSRIYKYFPLLITIILFLACWLGLCGLILNIEHWYCTWLSFPPPLYLGSLGKKLSHWLKTM